MSAERPFLKKSYADVVADLLADLARPVPGRTALADTTEGSVMRTLVEVFSRELAVAYEQLEYVYRFGYLDTAEGTALDQVVALLGITRRQAGVTEGLVSFSRATPAPQDIAIPEGTLVAGREVPAFATVEDTILAQGTSEVEVAVRAVEVFLDTVEPGVIAVMPRPILGIEGVTNHAPLAPRQSAETDDELRARARRARNQFHIGAVAVIEQAVAALGLADVRVQEHLPEQPGDIEVIIGDPDIEHLLPDIRLALEDVRPAGVRVQVRAARQIFLQLAVILELDPVPPDSEQATIQAQLLGAVERYANGLGPNQNVRWSKVRALLAAHDAVLDVKPVPPAAHGIEPFERLAPENDQDGPVYGSLAGSHLHSSGDIIIGAFERARFDIHIEALEPILRFEAPVLDVWIDVQAEISAGASVTEAALRDRLDEIVALEKAGVPARFSDWIDKLRPQTFARIVFTLMHDSDGRVVTLDDANDSDTLAPREVYRVRDITIMEQNGEATP